MYGVTVDVVKGSHGSRSQGQEVRFLHKSFADVTYESMKDTSWIESIGDVDSQPCQLGTCKKLENNSPECP